MFEFRFTYSDKNYYEVKGVNKIVIPSSPVKELVGDAILTTPLPLKTLYLYTANGNVTVSGTNLMVIDVIKQDN